MKISIEELPKSSRKIVVELEKTQVNDYFDRLLHGYAKKVKIPGFRKGKVPVSVLEMKLGKSLKAEVLDRIIDEVYEKARKENGMFPVAPGSADLGDVMPERNKPYSFTITVDVKPDVKIDGYKGLDIEKEAFEVTDEHVNAVLKQKQDEEANLLPVTDRPVAKGDWVLLEGQGMLGDKVVRDLSGNLVEVGSDSLPGKVNDALVGCSVDEEKSVSLEGASDAGAEIVYRFSVKEIKEKSVLILDDTFAKRSGDFRNLDDMKTNIRKQLTEFVAMRGKQDLRRQIVEKLVDKVKTDVPASMVKSQVEHMKKLAKVAGNDKADELSEEKFEELAIRKIKEYLVLEEVGRKENITVTDEEVNKVKASISRSNSGTEADTERIRSNLVDEKILDYLVANADIRKKEKSKIVKPDEGNIIVGGKK